MNENKDGGREAIRVNEWWYCRKCVWLSGTDDLSDNCFSRSDVDRCLVPKENNATKSSSFRISLLVSHALFANFVDFGSM